MIIKKTTVYYLNVFANSLFGSYLRIFMTLLLISSFILTIFVAFVNRTTSLYINLNVIMFDTLLERASYCFNILNLLHYYDHFFFIISFLVFFFSYLLAIAYTVLLERKLMGSIQRRKGPNKVGFFGTLQPLADGIKLLCKEYIFPKKANKYIFISVSLLTFVVSFMLLSTLASSFWSTFIYSNYTIFIILGILSFNTLFIPLAGWSSHSRYGFLGGIRDIAQIIAYELTLTTLLLLIFFTTKNISIYHIVETQIYTWNIIYLLPIYLIFVVVFLAKLNRVPFDLPEGEAEIVAGFNVEYSSFIFALFFLGEYGNIFFISVLTSILFFGGWLPYLEKIDYFYSILALSIKITFHIYLIIWIRGTLPRYRYDQLIKLGWKYLLPLSCFFLVFYWSLDILMLSNQFINVCSFVIGFLYLNVWILFLFPVAIDIWAIASIESIFY